MELYFMLGLFFGLPMIIGLVVFIVSTISTHRIKIEMVRKGMDPNTYEPSSISFDFDED